MKRSDKKNQKGSKDTNKARKKERNETRRDNEKAKGYGKSIRNVSLKT
jgi:hypothetical protein